jgi:hypothetical protein
LEGDEVVLSLSTMSAKYQRINCVRISGLAVQGYNEDVVISLPDVYTRESIPVRREHIPTPQMAAKWPHLKRIQHELLQLQDIEVGVLIGYNCSRALIPREVVAPIDNGPFAQRSDLGWGIVCVVDPISDVSSSYDSIGLSHRILTYQVPSDLLTVVDDGYLHIPDVFVLFNTSIKEVVTRMADLEFHEWFRRGILA